MKRNPLLSLLFLASSLLPLRSAGQDKSHDLVDRLQTLTSESQLLAVDSIFLNFSTYHTQGLTRVGDAFFLSSVDVKRWPRKYTNPTGKWDRDTGEGIGRVFRFDKSGNLTGEITIGQDSIYHPGGIDYDGKYIWIPVCEYRPSGNAIVYRMDPETMEVEKMWECPDALGGIICVGDSVIIGMNWDSQKFYRWRRSGTGNWESVSVQNNHAHTLRIQDGLYAGNGYMLCSGLNRWKNGTGSFTIGGLELRRTTDYSIVYQLPVSLKTPRGASLHGNPFYTDLSDGRFRLYFAPDDDRTFLYIYALKGES